MPCAASADEMARARADFPAEVLLTCRVVGVCRGISIPSAEWTSCDLPERPA